TGRDLSTARDRVEELRPIVLAGHERHWWKRPPRKVLAAAEAGFWAANEQRDKLDHRHGRLEHDLGRLEYERDVAAFATEDLHEAEQAQAARQTWLASHRQEVHWRDDLRSRI